MDFLEQVKDKVEMDDQTQRNVVAAGTVLALVGAVAAVLLRRNHVAVKETLREFQSSGMAQARAIVKQLPQIAKRTGIKDEDADTTENSQ